MLDRAGKVIGVARATILGGQNLNLAVPANVVATIAANPRRLPDDSLIPSSQTAAGGQMEKIARYIDAHLYPEARDQLGALVQENEFDPALRFALGEVLFQMQDYVQAARNFEVARQLDKGFWQAAEREADALLHIWETTKNIEARIAASRLYDDLSNTQNRSLSESASHAVSLLGIDNDLGQGRSRASKQMEGLMSPVGTWTTDDNRIFKITLSSGRWWLSSQGQTKYMWNVSFSASRSPNITGDGCTDNQTCSSKIAVEVSISDFATKMKVDGFPTGESVISPAYQGRSMAEVRSMNRICRDMDAAVKNKLNGAPMYRITLRRLQ